MYLMRKTAISLRNVVFINKTRTMFNVQKVYFNNTPSTQTFRFYNETSSNSQIKSTTVNWSDWINKRFSMLGNFFYIKIRNIWSFVLPFSLRIFIEHSSVVYLSFVSSIHQSICLLIYSHACVTTNLVINSLQAPPRHLCQQQICKAVNCYDN
jgi:hypothetical protein